MAAESAWCWTWLSSGAAWFLFFNVVVGAVAALTVVMLVQYRAPAAGLSRARTPGHFSGLRSSSDSDDQHHRPNGTTARAHVHQAPPVAGGPGRDDDHHLHRPANATTIAKPNSTSTHAAPSHLSRTHRRRQKVSLRSTFQISSKSKPVSYTP